MKNIRGASLITLVTATCFTALALGNAQATKDSPQKVKADVILAHRYGGTLDELDGFLKSSGYSKLGSFLVKDGDPEKPWKSNPNLSANRWCLRDDQQPRVEKNCIFTIQVELESDSRAAKYGMRDALEFMPTLGFVFLADDADGCISKLHPYRSIIAIGRWKNRKRPKVGGMGYSIKQAWLVDPVSRMFVEISPTEVVCEINDDRD